MALNNVTFTNAPGGLGRLPNVEDHVSGIFISLSASPAAWENKLGKKYRSVEEAEADGIVEGNAIYGILWYQIREFFRLAGAVELYVINYNDSTYSQESVFAFTKGRLRQIYYVGAATYATLAAHVGAMKTLATFFESKFAPVVILTDVKDEVSAVTAATLIDLRALNSETVAVINCGDGSGKGKELATALSIKYIPAGGAALGCLARAQVHQNIGWVSKFNLSQGSDIQKAILSDGSSIDEATDTLLNELNDKGYMFIRRLIGVYGMYINDTITATTSLSDLYSLENNRTLGKAKRVIRQALLPDLMSPLTVDVNGKLAADVVKYFENKTGAPLVRMQNAGELSNFKVTVDPEQNVLATSELLITVRIQPRGVARHIKVNIGFAVNLEA